jgi:hypothetical protein
MPDSGAAHNFANSPASCPHQQKHLCRPLHTSLPQRHRSQARCKGADAKKLDLSCGARLLAHWNSTTHDTQVKGKVMRVVTETQSSRSSHLCTTAGWRRLAKLLMTKFRHLKSSATSWRESSAGSCRCRCCCSLSRSSSFLLSTPAPLAPPAPAPAPAISISAPAMSAPAMSAARELAESSRACRLVASSCLPRRDMLESSLTTP